METKMQHKRLIEVSSHSKEALDKYVEGLCERIEDRTGGQVSAKPVKYQNFLKPRTK